MSVDTTPSLTTTPPDGDGRGAPPPTRTLALLLAGRTGGPLFVLIATVQVLARDGFDLTVLPLSALSLGGPGWIQIANFVAYGVAMLLLAAGVRGSLRGQPGHTAAPVLIAGYGVGLVLAGIFVTDPALGFPEGAPAGVPDDLTWHAQVHGIAASAAFGCAMVAAIVMARHFWKGGHRGWGAYSAITAVATIGCSPVVPDASVSLRLAVGTLVIAIWTTALGARLARAPYLP